MSALIFRPSAVLVRAYLAGIPARAASPATPTGAVPRPNSRDSSNSGHALAVAFCAPDPVLIGVYEERGRSSSPVPTSSAADSKRRTLIEISGQL
jgi:hypothetical protein